MKSLVFIISVFLLCKQFQKPGYFFHTSLHKGNRFIAVGQFNDVIQAVKLHERKMESPGTECRANLHF